VLSPIDNSSLIMGAAASNGWTTGYHYVPATLAKHAYRFNVVSGAFEELFPPCVRTVIDDLGLDSMIPPGHPAPDCLNDSTELIGTAGNAIDAFGNVAGRMEIGDHEFVRGYMWQGGGGPMDLQKLNGDLVIQEATAVSGTAVGPYHQRLSSGARPHVQLVGERQLPRGHGGQHQHVADRLQRHGAPGRLRQQPHPSRHLL
jgi:hypothetical protein